MTLQTLRSLAPSTAVVLALGTFLSILGPYDTHDLGLPWVWLYWTGLMALGWVSGVMFTALLAHIVPDWPRTAVGLALSILVSLPVATAVISIQAAVGSTLSLADLPLTFFLVWVISAGVVTVAMLAERTGGPGGTEARAGPALTEKLPPRLRRVPLLALQAEDHYLRVHTAAGDCLVLMRLGDAIAAVGALDGARTHRSWWVAREAVDQVSRGDGRATLTLKNGVEAPVSRTYAPKLREAGWY
jgi:hypothetical protein